MNLFYRHVSSWIESYYNAEALEWLRRFIEQSSQSESTKKRLIAELDLKKSQLENTPPFALYQNITYLVDNNGHPQVFTTRYHAVTEQLKLEKHGYKTELECTGTFFKIKLAGYLWKLSEVSEPKTELHEA